MYLTLSNATCTKAPGWSSRTVKVKLSDPANLDGKNTSFIFTLNSEMPPMSKNPSGLKVASKVTVSPETLVPVKRILHSRAATTRPCCAAAAQAKASEFMSNEVTLLSGYEIEISGGSVGEPDKMYGAMATLFPENGRKDALRGDPYTKEDHFRLYMELVVGVIFVGGDSIPLVRCR